MATESARPPGWDGVLSGDSWRPILDGSTASRAWDAIHDVALALQDPQEVRGPEYSLIEGMSGRALFYAYLGMATHGDATLERAFKLIETSVDRVSAATSGLGLMFGFPGVAWVVEHLDGRICEADEEDVNEGVDSAVLEILSATPDDDWWQGGHDVMYGLAGLGVYALERLPRPSGRQILELVINKLHATRAVCPEGVSWPSPKETIPTELREDFPDGVFSLGVAHGSPGVIGLLGRVYAAGIERERVRGLLTRAVDWLLAYRLKEASGSSFGHWSEDRTPARSAWCYGNLGIAPVLMTAARSTGEAAWEKIAQELALEAAERPYGESGVIDASFCHGAAGVAHLLNRAYQASGERRLRDSARTWFERTLDMRRPGHGLGGYQSYRQDEDDDTPAWKDDAGLLTGVTGIGLALLAGVTTQTPEWDRIFLAAIPPPPTGWAPA